MKRTSSAVFLATIVGLLGVGTLPAAAATTHWVNDDASTYSPPGVDCDAAGYATIQAAVTAAAAGDTVVVCAGTYAENVTIDTANLVIDGVGPTSIVTPGSGTAFVLNGNADGLLMQDMLIDGADVAQHGLTTAAAVDDVALHNLTITGATQRGIRIEGTAVATNWEFVGAHIDENLIGVRITGEAHDWTIDDSTFNENGSGTTGIGIEGFNDSGVAVIDGFNVTDSEFNDNANQKGMYFEMLSNAVFDDIDVLRNGTLSTYNAGAGIDINLKRGDYENITIQNSRIEDNGHANATFGGGLTIKARDDAPSYNGDPATLDGVWVTNNVIEGNAPDGLRLGEPGKSNLGPTDAHVNRNSITGNNSTAGNGLENASVPEADGSCNWWGAVSGPSGVGTGAGEEVSGNIEFNPFLLTSDLDGDCSGVPQLTRDDGSITLDEGDGAVNTGTFEVGSQEPLTFSASVGNVTPTGSNTGTWSWTYSTDDGPSESQIVEIEADNGESGSTTFLLLVQNLPPSGTFQAPSSVQEGTAFPTSITGVTDPSAADTTAGFSYAFDCGNGYGAFGPSASANCAGLSAGTYIVRGKVRDKDAGQEEYSKVLTVGSTQVAGEVVKKKCKDFKKKSKREKCRERRKNNKSPAAPMTGATEMGYLAND
jgi:hypothetical protein